MDNAAIIGVGMTRIEANKVREGRLDEILGCIYCDACHDDLRAGVAVACSQW